LLARNECETNCEIDVALIDDSDDATCDNYPGTIHLWDGGSGVFTLGQFVGGTRILPLPKRKVAKRYQDTLLLAL
jgi:hypothetical protein